jgi:hypothetical protein
MRNLKPAGAAFLPPVTSALKRLREAGLAIEQGDGGGWCTDFGALRRVAGAQVG